MPLSVLPLSVVAFSLLVVGEFATSVLQIVEPLAIIYISVEIVVDADSVLLAIL